MFHERQTIVLVVNNSAPDGAGLSVSLDSTVSRSVSLVVFGVGAVLIECRIPSAAGSVLLLELLHNKIETKESTVNAICVRVRR